MTMIWYVPLKMQFWKQALVVGSDEPTTSVAEIAGVPGSAGFLPCYPTWEAMAAVHGDDTPYTCISIRKEEGQG